ncbi:phosphatidylserine synthase [Lepeophtheirus salmonis]|uniref:Phosphatidylserine synthase n=1 Tax=Lepeophtheirus salmonis TaxID=72036 RepID=A0A0K2SVS3_LEPSM|nr:phosphatidylserine synthase-like isoform X1 [Lepeophtheirus salmonis]
MKRGNSKKKVRSESVMEDNASSDEEEEDRFTIINERPVDDISVNFFYKPHTISLLLLSVVGISVIAFSRDENMDSRSNIWVGLLNTFVFFMMISVLSFPHGPFTRPHPILWRMVFGVSVIYLLIIQFLIQQDYNTVRGVIIWFDPKMANYSIDKEKEYGAQCWDISMEKLWAHLDWFAFGHYWGWGMKALIIRHYGICWSISIMWELTEMAFGHLLPNFYECWWDNIILDVLICNGLGIFTGMTVCRWLEMREYHWESFKEIRTTKGKVKRVLLQFTPESWSSIRWMDPSCSKMRVVFVTQFMLIWQTVELNTFFLKHIFPMPVEHPICVIRILMFGLIAAPATRQYYMYMTDTQVKRLGTQTWVFLCICLSELILNIKFGLDLFSQTQISKIGLWLLMVVLTSALGTLFSMKISKWRHQSKQTRIHNGAKDQLVERTKSD